MSMVPEINRHIAMRTTEALATIACNLGRDDLAEPLCCGWDSDQGQTACDEVVHITKPATRTAEQERADMLAYLKAEEERNRLAAPDFVRVGFTASAEHCDVRASLLRSLIAHLTRGDHEGATTRESPSAP